MLGTYHTQKNFLRVGRGLIQNLDGLSLPPLKFAYEVDKPWQYDTENQAKKLTKNLHFRVSEEMLKSRNLKKAHLGFILVQFERELCEE